jgi:hypothetical protein
LNGSWHRGNRNPGRRAGSGAGLWSSGWPSPGDSGIKRRWCRFRLRTLKPLFEPRELPGKLENLALQPRVLHSKRRQFRSLLLVHRKRNTKVN